MPRTLADVPADERGVPWWTWLAGEAHDPPPSGPPSEVAWALQVKPGFSEDAQTAKLILAQWQTGDCAQCHGKGSMEWPHDAGGGMSVMPCPPCGGTGKLWLRIGQKARKSEVPVSERAVSTPRDNYGWRGLSTGSRRLDKEDVA